MIPRPGSTFRGAFEGARRALAGMWVSSGSMTAAEICAGSGLDLLFVDMEHSAATLESVMLQLQVMAAYPVTAVVRVPASDPVMIKRVLDVGAENLLVPMIGSVAEAEAAVRAVRYPPHGVRGVGSALARSARWGRLPHYLRDADDLVSLLVQVESPEGVESASAIAAVDGVDGVLIGPADLAVSMGYGAQQTHPEVIAAVHRVFADVQAAGKKVGVNAFDPAVADAYIEAGADFVTVAADVTVLARGTEALAARYVR